MYEVTDIVGQPQGAVFRRCDLHVHTPASADMHEKWRQSSPDELVQHALRQGLDVIAVTDHNSVEWCDPVRKAASGTRLTVLPGVEISTSEGHVLAIFDPDKPASELREFLVQIGIRERDYGNLDAISDRGILETAEAIEREGGLAIAAHVERERGFLQMVKTGARRSEVLSSRFIRAFEVVDPSLRDKYATAATSGRKSAIACLQGSDCWPPGGDMHHLDAVGTRSCYLKLDDISIWALRQATFDPQLRVRLGQDARPIPHSVIEALWVSGGFLGGQKLRFSDDITCLIGDTGSGKSLAIELIRFALDQQVEPILPKIHEETSKLLGFALREMDTVFVLVRKDEQRYVVERPWLERGTAPPVIYRIAGSKLEQLEGPIHVPSFFQIKGYSQSEIIEYAREPLARLSLIDSLIDTGPEREAIARIKSDLQENASELLRLQAEVARAQRQLDQLPGLTEEIERLSQFLQHPEVKQREVWQKEQRSFEAVAEAITGLRSKASADFPGAGSTVLADEELPPEPLNADLLGQLKELATNAVTLVGQKRDAFVAELRGVEQQLSVLKSEWDTRFEQADGRYRAAVSQLEEAAHGQAAVLAKVAKLQEQEEGLKRRKRTLETQTLPRMQEVEQRREELLSGLQDARKALTEKRRKKADQLSKALEGKVAIEIGHADEVRDFKKKLMELRTGSYVRDDEIDALVNANLIHPVPLVKSLLAKDFATPAVKAGVPAASLERLYENIVSKDWLDELYELQIVDLEDVVRVRFAVAEHTYRDLEALAHGQKCTVVLMISLAEGDFPLLVDQPEDALHAPWIEGYIVSTLRNRRGTRQCIFATRSANVLVSSDSEQVLALQADSTRGQVEKTGSIDRFDTRELVLFHVEGGEEAFRRRQDKYGLDLPKRRS
jgi:PHP family Zn ribbon phosphoesterase